MTKYEFMSAFEIETVEAGLDWFLRATFGSKEDRGRVISNMKLAIDMFDKDLKEAFEFVTSSNLNMLSKLSTSQKKQISDMAFARMFTK